MIAIIDYGLGNILAFANVYKRLNIPFNIVKTGAELQGATKIILPGVGSFDYAMRYLQQSKMISTLNEMVLVREVPIIGICVGMQILSKSSDEGNMPGLGWVNAIVRKYVTSIDGCKMPIPHMGWNDVNPLRSSPLFENIEEQARFYFLHSYYMHCADSEDVLCVSDYGLKFCSVVNHRNIYGVQFHPEKSHQYGIQLLKNFARM